ncbi:murein L,D-transpeptidase family protein [Shimia sp. R10_1]|uniref:L,D-transpeptidase family protein n=1 Tax=Shimia sp. R10_1 TaxID=2821095 RepID=UPI001FFDFA64|nr:murein L,D-transpeptidase family protein [Shimia sp. R10_1]
MRRLLAIFVACSALAVLAIQYTPQIPTQKPDLRSPRSGISEIRAYQTPRLSKAMADAGTRLGAPTYIRIFKEEKTLELWLKSEAGPYQLFRSYPICNHSGALGPKLKEGDRQSPEGFYRVDKAALNPNSSYHLSFNLGFPNRYDRAQRRTGSYLMVHGDCVSVGCYAMTDPMIEEIYVTVEAALKGGQAFVPVHAFPFRPTEARMAKASGHRWESYWQSLAPAYHSFASSHQPPAISVQDGRYVVTP